MLKEFKPVILFLLKFLGIYLIGNLAYGFWITSYYPGPDPATVVATEHSSHVLNILGWSNQVETTDDKPISSISSGGYKIVSVYEGCNGINVAVVFVSFIFAFGHLRKMVVWFTLLGFLLIYLANITRISLLFIVAQELPDYFYLTHKYLFTASIYLIVFGLWIWWVKAIAFFGITK